MSKFTGHDNTYHKTRFRGKLRHQDPNPNNPPKITYVKKAGSWVKSYFEFDAKGKAVFKQKWADTREELENEVQTT